MGAYCWRPIGYIWILMHSHAMYHYAKQDVASRLAERAIALAVSDAALEIVLTESYDPVYGDGLIRRWLEKKVVTELSKMLLREEIDENSTVYIDASLDGAKLTYRVEKNGGLVNANIEIALDTTARSRWNWS
ncbi:chaperone protein ClpB1-like [Papaver somniferum]|uniref:chaperone protein ClpB1-like n=1 Tax=Papaver somniferum TaxID=3469 RepID=UPI000E702CD9|nr:chaperone protein ClpB1-like [Papaver somniferum]